MMHYVAEGIELMKPLSSCDGGDGHDDGGGGHGDQGQPGPYPDPVFISWTRTRTALQKLNLIMGCYLKIRRKK